ncbi:class I adenylate-forming enzyme family protein [Tomitella biformata]|uniref:class I adenylate-forming enzyme family protein n=1 Tax=Tomitella biformata TaxID=630403 RepID=UPI000466262C|nr:class I adenylate-forming enzyme family protein [Tomitella biformata]
MAALTREAAIEQVTGPGGPLEVGVEQVQGHPLPVYTGRSRALRDMLLDSAKYGDTEYLICDGLRLTYTENLRRVTALSHAFKDEYGLGKGDRVAILAANSAEWIMSFWAATSLGAVVVGMNAFWSRAEIEYGLDHSEPKILIADTRRRENIGTMAADRGIPMLSIEEDIVRLATEPGAPAELPAVEIDEDDAAVILYTSGTTGRPKGAVHSHRNVIAAADFFRFNDELMAAFGRPRTMRNYLMTSPLFHIAGLHNLSVPRLVAGDTLTIYTGRFEVDRVLRVIEAERIESWGAVPTMASRLVERGDLSGYDLSSLKTISLGSAPSSVELKEKLRKLIPAVAQSLGTNYGQTECSTAATFATAADLEADPTTVGKAIQNVEVVVMDTAGAIVPDGVEGEICVRGAQVMLGYWNNPEATAEAIDAAGWLHTGDLGTMRDGYLTISSRRSDLILRGGENVYPVEIENALATHPRVLEAAVVGLEHHDLGEEVGALVVLDAADAAGGEELCAHLAEQIAKYKIPTKWRFTTELLPRNATGKVIRHGLDELITN